MFALFQLDPCMSSLQPLEAHARQESADSGLGYPVYGPTRASNAQLDRGRFAEDMELVPASGVPVPSPMDAQMDLDPANMMHMGPMTLMQVRLLYNSVPFRCIRRV